MKWTFFVQNKMRAALLLALVFALVFWNNWQERSGMEQLDSHLSMLYKDRLLVEGYIYELSEAFHAKAKAAASHHPTRPATEGLMPGADIQSLIAQYETTYLTPEEKELFGLLKGVVGQLSDLEKARPFNSTLYLSEINSAHRLLHRLSGIQIAEGTRLSEASHRIVLGSNLTAQIEMVLLIILALIIQALVLSAKALHSPVQQKFNLN